MPDEDFLQRPRTLGPGTSAAHALAYAKEKLRALQIRISVKIPDRTRGRIIVLFLFLLALVCFSLSVPPGDLFLFGVMLAIAAAGTTLCLNENRKWRLLWAIAIAISVLGGILEIVAGKRIA